jgi:hypothetical protein
MAALLGSVEPDHSEIRLESAELASPTAGTARATKIRTQASPSLTLPHRNVETAGRVTFFSPSISLNVLRDTIE